MALIRSGILGNTRGKVAGVVASQWKDKNYIREYVKPANPNSAGQQAQRGKMSKAVSFVKGFISPVLNRWADPFLKSLSGYNQFIKSNISKFGDTVDYSTISLFDGSLVPLPSFRVTDITAGGVVSFEWNVGDLPQEVLNSSVYVVAKEVSTNKNVYSLNGTLTVDVGFGEIDFDSAVSGEVVVFAWYDIEVDGRLQSVSIPATAVFNAG